MMDAIEVIRQHMGNVFVDAIYEGTTDHTLTGHFVDALNEIAAIVRVNYIARKDALDILTKHCPDSAYNPRNFMAAFPAEPASART